MAWLGVACGGSAPGNSSTGTGARAGTGGAAGAASGTGGMAGTTAGDAGGLDGRSCIGDELGPVDTMETPRPTFGWTFTGPVGDAGAGSAGAADAGPPPGDASTAAGCVSVPGPTAPFGVAPGISCRGTAQLRMRTTGPEIAFADGSSLFWDGTWARAFAPFVEQATGDTVWVAYEMRTQVVCPFCGSYTTRTLEVRNGEGGKVRLFTQNGAVLPTLTDAQLLDIFGVTAEPVATCSFRATAGCQTFVRTDYAHILHTTPEVEARAEWSQPIATPKGAYRVYWASSTETDAQSMPGCYDGPGIATDNGFIAVLTTP